MIKYHLKRGETMKEFIIFMSLAFPITGIILGFIAINNKINKIKVNKKNRQTQYKRFDDTPKSVTLEELITRNNIKPKINIQEREMKPKKKIKGINK